MLLHNLRHGLNWFSIHSAFVGIFILTFSTHAQADVYKSGQYRFDAGNISPEAVQDTVVTILGIAPANRLPVVILHWPAASAVCYRINSAGTLSLREPIATITKTIDERTGTSIEPCSDPLQPSISYFSTNGQFGASDQGEIRKSIGDAADAERIIRTFEDGAVYCSWRWRGDGSTLASSTVIINEKSMSSSQADQCLFAATIGSLGLPAPAGISATAHRFSHPISDWKANAELNLLALFVLHRLQEKLPGRPSTEDALKAVQDILSEMKS